MRQAREIWVQVVRQFEQSGLTQEAFAEQRNIPVGTLRSWIYRLRREGDDDAQILPVRVIPSTAPLTARPVEPAVIEVELDGRVRLRFPVDTAPSAIAEVVALVRARC